MMKYFLIATHHSFLIVFGLVIGVFLMNDAHAQYHNRYNAPTNTGYYSKNDNTYYYPGTSPTSTSSSSYTNTSYNYYPPAPPSFSDEQLRFPRVSEAKTATDRILRLEMESRGFPISPIGIFMRVFKKEGILEIWMQNNYGSYEKFKEYTICANSGRLGPKRQQGDKQMPEGFYYIEKFNPTSSYYLSLGINYPNKSDRVLGNRRRLGGDIYIHGDCKTVGCVPLTDGKMKEVYWLSVQAKSNGQTRIPVHIFPYKFNNSYHDQMEKERNRHLISFWENLKQGYDYFEQNRRLPSVGVASNGHYTFW